MKRFRIGHWLKTSLWFVPITIVLGGVVLSLIVTAIDDGTLIPQEVSGDPTAALQILYLISFAMLTLTGLVLSLLVLAVQLAMGTFSPRIVRQILQDRPSQVAIGLFAGTFAFSMLAMRHVRVRPDGSGSVPGLAVILAILLVLACVATLVWYLNHITQSLRTAALTGWVARDTVTALDRVYPQEEGDPVLASDLIPTRISGVVFEIDHDRLVDIAVRADCRLEVLWTVGDFVPMHAALVRIVGGTAAPSQKKVARAVALGPERTLNEDVAYGIRMLVDIAERSLSAGPFEDPTTAVQAIDRLHDVLRRIARRPLHSGRYYDDDGTLRLVVPTMQWEGFVRLTFDEIRQSGAGSPQVVRRLRAALEDLLEIAPADRRPALEGQLVLLGRESDAAAETGADREAAQVPDPSGLGSSDDLTDPRDLHRARA